MGHISSERPNECRDGHECLVCGKSEYESSDHKWQRKNCVERLCTKCQKVQKITKAKHHLKLV
jgi:hypothetical protein